MADVRPLPAIRFAPALDLSRIICPPYDIIPPEEQRRLYDLDPHNAVRLEGPAADDPYAAAATTLKDWLADGTLVRDSEPAFYLYRQEFAHGERTYTRSVLFARVRLEPWEAGVILPHERTFRAPIRDRLDLLRAIRMNTSPIFMMYPDAEGRVAGALEAASAAEPAFRFQSAEGLPQRLWRIAAPDAVAAISGALADQKLYIADGHHRYETALAFRDEAAPADPEVPERFVFVALAAVDDPGLLVLPIHRLTAAGVPLQEALDRLTPLFEVETRPSLPVLLGDMADRGGMVNAFGLVAAESPDLFLLTLYEPDAADAHLPRDRSPAWRRLDAAVADHVVMRHVLGLSDAQMEDYDTLWFHEDATTAVADVREGRARYALLLNPISPRRVLAIADDGERMPQKSTFFYPKVPTGLLFNPLF